MTDRKYTEREVEAIVLLAVATARYTDFLVEAGGIPRSLAEQAAMGAAEQALDEAAERRAAR